MVGVYLDTSSKFISKISENWILNFKLIKIFLHNEKIENSAYTQPTHVIFGMVKDADNIYYCTKNQVRELCVVRDMVILFLVRSMVKWPYLRLRTTHGLDFWYSNRYCEDLLPYQKLRWVGCV